jgi:predicted kinase
MIINLTGPIAAGKSSFAKWFVERHPSWQHLAIDEFRKEAVEFYTRTKAYPNQVEDRAIIQLQRALQQYGDFIVESSGNIYKMATLWTPWLVDRGIYTVYLDASTDECQERARRRDRKMPPPYDGDESLAIAEGYMHGIMPSNLYVSLTGAENLGKVYQEVEWYILKAKAFFDAKEVGHNKIV